MVTDFDWAAGDDLRILTPDGGHSVRSQNKVAALIASGWLSVTARDDATGRIAHVAGRPDQQLGLAFTVTADLLDWIS